jgi:hypothetical protein
MKLREAIQSLSKTVGEKISKQIADTMLSACASCHDIDQNCQIDYSAIAYSVQRSTDIILKQAAPGIIKSDQAYEQIKAIIALSLVTRATVFRPSYDGSYLLAILFFLTSDARVHGVNREVFNEKVRLQVDRLRFSFESTTFASLNDKALFLSNNINDMIDKEFLSK